MKARPVQCPTCALSQQFEYAKWNARVLIKRHLQEDAKPEEVEYLFTFLTRVLKALRASRDRIDPGWPADFAQAVEVYIEERERLEAVDRKGWKQGKGSRDEHSSGHS